MGSLLTKWNEKNYYRYLSHADVETTTDNGTVSRQLVLCYCISVHHDYSNPHYLYVRSGLTSKLFQNGMRDVNSEKACGNE